MTPLAVLGLINIIKGAAANLDTFREQPVSEGIKICFRTLELKSLQILKTTSIESFCQLSTNLVIVQINCVCI